MRALTLSAVAILACASTASSQLVRRPSYPPAPTARNAAYFEILGAGGNYSLNYERIAPNLMLFRLGATNGGWRNADNVLNGERALIITVGRELHVSVPGGEPDSPIEVGGGFVVGSQWLQHGSIDERGSYAAIVGALGLRSHQTGHGYLWRLTFTPLFNFSAVNDNTKKGFQPYGGGSVGWIF